MSARKKLGRRLNWEDMRAALASRSRPARGFTPSNRRTSFLLKCCIETSSGLFTMGIASRLPRQPHAICLSVGRATIGLPSGATPFSGRTTAYIHKMQCVVPIRTSIISEGQALPSLHVVMSLDSGSETSSTTDRQLAEFGVIASRFHSSEGY